MAKFSKEVGMDPQVIKVSLSCLF
jgi:cyclin-dependent kinase